MKDMDLSVLLSVFLEMMGPAFWLLLLSGAVGIALFARAWLREGGLMPRRLVWAEIIGLFGGFVALGLMAAFTLSGFTDAGGPIDWLIVGAVWGIGLAGGTILAYGVLATAGLPKAH